MWATFFLIPVGRGVEEQRLTAEEIEATFEKLWHHARVQPYSVKTTEAPHYRRFVMQKGGDPLAGPQGCRMQVGTAATAHRWVWATARASCSSATAARSTPPASCPCCAAAILRRTSSTPTRITRCSAPARSGSLSRQVRHLRVPPPLRRQSCAGLRRLRRPARFRTRLRLTNRQAPWN